MPPLALLLLLPLLHLLGPALAEAPDRSVLSFSAACAGDQYDRVATPEGVSWTVRKEVTRYSALLRSPPDGVLSVMLENLVNDEYTGVYNVTVSLEFHGTPAYLSGVNSPSSDAGVADPGPATPTLPESYFQPADLILPISEATRDSGYWFRIQNSSDSRSKLVTIPSSTYRAVLEVFVSPHSNDEFWYSNPPDLYIHENNLTTQRGNAAYREVVVSVDHHFAGSFVPFPVIYTGGINPLYWQPVSALGAFDLPTYDIELTPFLGLLVDGKAHEFGISVVETELEARSLVEFTKDGRNKTVQMKAEQETEVLVRSEARKVIGKLKTESEYPLSFYMDTEDGEDGMSVVTGSLSHTFKLETEVKSDGFENESTLVDEQTAKGWMVVKDHDVINGSAATSQMYRYSDDRWRYQRMIDAVDGLVLGDNVSESYRVQDAAKAKACLPGRSCDGTASAAERWVYIAAIKSRNIDKSSKCLQKFIMKSHSCDASSCHNNFFVALLIRWKPMKPFFTQWMNIVDLLGFHSCHKVNEATFRMKGFSAEWHALIHSFVFGGSVSIKVNDDVVRYFQTKKGLRKGDSLSPMLFNIVADMLAVMIERANVDGH
uniref:Peptide N-acetyl-beta-D-glucosaminyl asparaginase amidase A N-terminal domain-containing protein n=1 Tax=Aegilops tauschii TaxID=37682 RepID=M8CAY7_AEGTA